jgi:hypothetical protein
LLIRHQCGNSLIGMQPNKRLTGDKDGRRYAVFMDCDADARKAASGTKPRAPA